MYPHCPVFEPLLRWLLEQLQLCRGDEWLGPYLLLNLIV